jgi:FkbH-like protein
MSWLPLAEDFRAELAAAQEIVDANSRLDRLAMLARTRLGYLETIQMDKALRRAVDAAGSERSRLHVALLASTTVEHLLPAIRVGGLRHGLLLDVRGGGYGQYRQEIIDASSWLYGFQPDYILVNLHARDLIAGIPLHASGDTVDAALGNAVAELSALWHVARERTRATLIQQTAMDVAEPLFGSYDRLVPAAPARLVARANDLIADAAAREGVLILDVERLSARDGLGTWFDRTRWLQGKIEIAPQAAPYFGEVVARLIAAQRGLSKKCLVLDLDNTLWGGVIGDDGIEGVRLGEGSAVGEAHSTLQRYAKALAQRGVILAVCSKNEPAIAEAAFDGHPEMVLQRSDIAAFVVNWQDKAENLRAIAEQLNIGLDSLVFVDDNPVERARIRAALPAVSVPELPEDPAHYTSCIAAAGYFEAVAFTDEDRQRTINYVANGQREALRDISQDMDQFLARLDMTVVHGPVRALDIRRVTQLLNKTNQFNTTSRRYNEDQLRAITVDPAGCALQFRLVDKFGDNGIVSVMILKPVAGTSDALEIDTWVMSCRVFGRQLELEALNIAVGEARCRGARALEADFVPTKKNAVVQGLYESLGFVRTRALNESDDVSRWLLDLAGFVPRQTRIRREVK